MVKKNSCSVKSKKGPYDHSPRKLPVEGSIFNKSVNFLIKQTALKTNSNFFKTV